MAITAQFSNGHTHAYKGARPVTAAWMIVTPEGKVISGHSLDRRRAEATARKTAAEAAIHKLTNEMTNKAAVEAKGAFLAGCCFEVVDL